jgi:hypothetical protein
MAETVQYYLERMLPELEDLRDKGLLSEVGAWRPPSLLGFPLTHGARA